MELVPGGELSSYVNTCKRKKEHSGIKDTACDFNCVKFYSSEIVEALQFIHGCGVLHRDLKV